MSIGRKITRVFILVFVLTSLSHWFMSQQQSYRLLTKSMEKELAGFVSVASEAFTDDLVSGLYQDEKEAIEKGKLILNHMSEHVELLEDVYVIDTQQQFLLGNEQAFMRGYKSGKSVSVVDSAFKKANNGEFNVSTGIYERNEDKTIAAYAPILDENGKVSAVLMAHSSLDSIQTFDIWRLIMGLIVPSISLILGSLYVHKMMKPLQVMTKEVQTMAKGDLSFVPSVVKTKDEIGMLSASFKDMAESLAQLIERIRLSEQKIVSSAYRLKETAESTASLTQGIHQGVVEVNEGAKNQLFQTRESAAAMDEISSQVLQIAKNSEVMKKSTANTVSSIQEMAASIEEVSKGTQKASELSKHVQLGANSGREQASASRSEMLEIAKIMESANEVMSNLGKSSEEIGRIVEVIDGIAEQTNLLALNAAIEAARAGEAGKGFSVVADEVKNLAERSASATKEITMLIKGVQAETKEAIHAIEVGNERITKGTDIAEEASIGMEQIASAIEEISNELAQISYATNEQAKESNAIVDEISKLEEQVNQVAKATQEQTIGVNEITRSISKIAEISQVSNERLDHTVSEMVQGNASMDEMNLAVSNLNEITSELKASIHQFKLKEE